MGYYHFHFTDSKAKARVINFPKLSEQTVQPGSHTPVRVLLTGISFVS